MATLFRALVMLSVLVGLPAAWIYYGPLPPQAQRIADRFVAAAKEAIDWKDSAPMPADERPQYEYLAPGDPRLRAKASLPSAGFPIPQAAEFALDADRLPPAAATQVAPPDEPPAESISSTPATPGAAIPAPPEGQHFAQRVEPFLQQLRELGAVEYVLERWGDGSLFRFSCEMPLGPTPQLTQQFEAVSPDPAQSVEQVVAQISTWRLAQRETLVQ